MYHVYALQSKVDGRIYVGLSRNVEIRLRDHNSGRVFSTKGYKPWIIFYREECKDRIEARKREKYLKSGCGKEFLKSIMPK
jgi:putative endonuclease